jgi:probable rRNA maturation factor
MSAPLRLEVFVRNHAARRGVPVARSFEHWVRAALAGRRGGRVDVNIALFGMREARLLNRDWRQKDYATNVLSFPYRPEPGERSALIGDLAICPAVVAREAREQRKAVRDHFAHLTVHGVLHLLGYDHENERDALEMEGIERKVLAKLGMSDPYA